MLCPQCAGDTGVVDTRATDHNAIRRRRVCADCGYRLTTFEIVSEHNPSSDAAERMLRQAAKLRTVADRIEQILSRDKPEP